MVNPTHKKKKYQSREASVLLIEENRNLTGALRKKVKGSLGIWRPQFCFPEKQTPFMQGRFVCGKFRFTMDHHPWGQLFNGITKRPPQGDLVDKMKGSWKKFKRTKTYNEVDFSTFISSLKTIYAMHFDSHPSSSKIHPTLASTVEACGWDLIWSKSCRKEPSGCPQTLSPAPLTHQVGFPLFHTLPWVPFSPIYDREWLSLCSRA